MEEVNYMMDIFKQYGIAGVVVVGIASLLIIVMKTEWMKKLLTKLGDKLVEWFMKEKTKNSGSAMKIAETDICNHDIFNYIDFWKYSKIPTIQFSTEYRTAVFRKYLTIYLKSYKSNLKSFLEEKSYMEMDNAKIWKSFLDLINRIIYDYERDMAAEGIPKIVIEKMKAKNNETVGLIIDLIEGICSSNFYESEKNLLKVYSILNIIQSVLDNTISQADKVCNSINGQLAGLSISEGGKTITEPGKQH